VPEPGPSSTAAAFDRAAAHWDEAHGPASERAEEFAARIRYLRALCRRFDRPRLLELGCGTGQNLLHLADLLSAGVGLDISPAMVARARSNAASASAHALRFAIGDANDFDLPDEPFDIVLFAGTLEHLPDPSAALGRARRALARRGSLVVIMPHPWNPLVRLRRLLDPCGEAEPPARHLPPNRLAALAARQGLRRAALHGLPYTPWPRLRLGAASTMSASEAPPPGGPLAGILLGAYAAEFRCRP